MLGFKAAVAYSADVASQATPVLLFRIILSIPKAFPTQSWRCHCAGSAFASTLKASLVVFVSVIARILQPVAMRRLFGDVCALPHRVECPMSPVCTVTCAGTFMKQLDSLWAIKRRRHGRSNNRG